MGSSKQNGSCPPPGYTAYEAGLSLSTANTQQETTQSKICSTTQGGLTEAALSRQSLVTRLRSSHHLLTVPYKDLQNSVWSSLSASAHICLCTHTCRHTYTRFEPKETCTFPPPLTCLFLFCQYSFFFSLILPQHKTTDFPEVLHLVSHI